MSKTHDTSHFTKEPTTTGPDNSDVTSAAPRRRFVCEKQRFTYDSSHEPIGIVEAGETFEVETLDCWSGLYQHESGFTPENRAYTAKNYDGVNGPVFVRGASPGDVVAVTLHNVEITTVGSVVLSRCTSPSPRYWWGEEFACRAFPIEDGEVIISDSKRIPIRPLVGCIATAPAREVLLSPRQGVFGGNMDCAEITSGATVVLPVEHEGALLYFGDCKAVMGDGEITQPPEVGTLITASVAVRTKPKTMRWPRVETDEALVTIVSGPSLADACRSAYKEMLDWLESEYEMERHEGATLMAMVAQTGLCQITSPFETAKCIMPRRWLA